MSSDNAPPSTMQKKSGGLLHFLENALSLFLMLLMAVGLVAITATWRNTTIEFIGSDRMRITQNEWWGAASSESLYRSTPAGWVVIRPNSDEVPVALQPIKIND